MNNKDKKGGVVWMLSTFALIGILIGLGISSLDDPEGSATVPMPSDVIEEEVVYTEATIDDDAVLGSEDAPVTMIIFSDYQCPYCQMFETDTMPYIIENYVDTGLVKVVFRDYPLSSHQYAHITAEAAECAGDYDLYWDYHDLLIANSEEWENYDGNYFELFSEYAAGLGIDYDEYYACISSGKHYDEVNADAEDGWNAGVGGTPSCFINGKMVVGALPYEDYMTSDGTMHEGYESIINQVLEEVQ